MHNIKKLHLKFKCFKEEMPADTVKLTFSTDLTINAYCIEQGALSTNIFQLTVSTRHEIHFNMHAKKHRSKTQNTTLCAISANV